MRMGLGPVQRFIGVPVVLLILTVSADELVNSNSSAGGLVWSSAKEESDLMPTAEPLKEDFSGVAPASNDQVDLDGGFSSLDGMLQWAIGHSDPMTLKETAQQVQRLSPGELNNRQLEVQELMNKMKMPSDAQLIQIAIDDLKNSSVPLGDRHRALQELLILVEPIDNANDLNKLGGLTVVIEQLHHPDTDTRRLSAWVIGKASQNNGVVQKQALELGALTALMKMVRSTFVEEAIKALYAVSALIRNNLAAQELFYSQAGDMMLQDIMSNSINDIRLHKKALSLVGDLIENQIENKELSELPFIRNQFFIKSIVDLTASTDLDLQEKVLVAIKSILQLRATEVLIFKDFCGLDGALERMRQQLQDLMVQEDHRDNAMDMENLRQEVELIFNSKLGKVGAVRIDQNFITGYRDSDFLKDNS